MNAIPDLAVTVELVRIYQEVTDVNANQDTLEDTVKPVSVVCCEVISSFCLYKLNDPF